MPIRLARIAVGWVFVINVTCACSFLFYPELYTGSFELGGLPGKLVVQSYGIMFLMWNATYPPVIRRPFMEKTLFAIILLQQLIGLAGETWLWLQLPGGHPLLWQTGQRFVLYDGFGLMIMAAAYLLLFRGLPAGGSGPANHGSPE